MHPLITTLSTLLLCGLCGAAPPPVPQSPTVPPATPRLVWGDFDADGRLDALALAAGLPPRLLRNAGDGSFVDSTESAGLGELPPTTVASWRDVDGDGDLDLAVAGEGVLALRLGDGRGSFVPAPDAGPCHPGGASVALAWLDYDGDGQEDLHLSSERGDVVLRNLGNGVLEPVDMGLFMAPPLGPAPSVSDARAGAATAGGGRPATGSAGAGGIRLVGPHGAASPAPSCVDALRDQALGSCLTASSVPVLGSLLPLSLDFNLDPAGNVGLGTTAPGARLDVVGDVRARGRLESTATSGAPLVVASSALVPGLNADLLDGLDASAFSQLGASIDSTEIEDGSIAQVDLGRDSVGAAQLAAGAVGASELAAQAVTAAAIAAGAVETSKVADETLLDSDVSPTAAIAGTKVVPAFGAQNVTTDGDLGLGTSAPQTKLHVATGTDVSALGGSYLQLGDAAALNLALDSNEIMARSNGVPANLILNAEGGTVVIGGLGGKAHVGVNTTTPDAALHVVDGSAGAVTGHASASAVFERSAQNYLNVLAPEGLSKGILFGSPTDVVSGGILYDQSVVAAEAMQFRTGGNLTRMTISSTGDVGIGTTAPTGRLHVSAPAGDGSVVLPSDAVSSDEILDEPGLAFVAAMNKQLTSTTPVAAAGRTIACPSAGYVLALASCRIRNGYGTPSLNKVSISESKTSHNSSNATIANTPGLDEQFPTVQGIFAVSAGSRTYYLLGSKNASGDPDVTLVSPRMSLIFVPTAYGVVEVD